MRNWRGCGAAKPASRPIRKPRATCARASKRFIADPSFAPHAVVVTAPLRPLLAEFFERVGPRIDVYAFGEIPPGVDLEPAAVLDAAR